MDHLLRTKKEYKKLKKQEIRGEFKNLPRRTASDKMLHVKVYNIAKNKKYDGYQRGLVSMVYKFFDKKSSVVAVTHAWSETLATQNKSSTKSRIMLS